MPNTKTEDLRLLALIKLINYEQLSVTLIPVDVQDIAQVNTTRKVIPKMNNMKIGIEHMMSQDIRV